MILNIVRKPLGPELGIVSSSGLLKITISGFYDPTPPTRIFNLDTVWIMEKYGSTFERGGQYEEASISTYYYRTIIPL